MPEGIACWNGSDWRWIARINHGLTQDVVNFGEGLATLDADGSVSLYDASGSVLKRPGPAGLERVHPKAAVAAPSFFGLSPINPDQWVLVGDYGLIYRSDSSGWNRVAVDSDGRLVQIVRTGETWLIAGYGGSLFSFDGAACTGWPMASCDDVLAIDRGFDGSVLALVKSADVFTLRALQNKQVALMATMPHDVLAIGVLDAEQVVYTSYDGVYLWNKGEVRMLFQDEMAGQIQKTDIEIAIASQQQDCPVIWFGHPRKWEMVKIDLDERFLK